MNAAIAAMLNMTPSAAHFNPLPQMNSNSAISSNTIPSIDLSSQLMNAVFAGARQDNTNNTSFLTDNISSNLKESEKKVEPKKFPKTKSPQIKKEGIQNNDKILTQTNAKLQNTFKAPLNTTSYLCNTVSNSESINNNFSTISNNGAQLLKNSYDPSYLNLPETSGLKFPSLNNTNNLPITAKSNILSMSTNNSMPSLQMQSFSSSLLSMPQQSTPQSLSNHFINPYLSGSLFTSPYTPIFYNYGNNSAQQENFVMANHQLLSVGDMCDICNDRVIF